MIPIGNYEYNKLNDMFYTKIRFEEIKPYFNEKIKHEIVVNKQTHATLKSNYFIATKTILLFSKKLRKNYTQIMNVLT